MLDIFRYLIYAWYKCLSSCLFSSLYNVWFVTVVTDWLQKCGVCQTMGSVQYSCDV